MTKVITDYESFTYAVDGHPAAYILSKGCKVLIGTGSVMIGGGDFSITLDYPFTLTTVDNVCQQLSDSCPDFADKIRAEFERQMEAGT